MIAVTIMGCSTSSSNGTQPEVRVAKPAPIDPWKGYCLNPSESTPALLWNGLIGLRFRRDMSSKDQNLFVIDEYEKSGEEKIRPLANPMPRGFLVDGNTIPLDQNYTQELDLKSSTLTTKWEANGLKVSCLATMDPNAPIIGERWTLEGSKPEQKVDFDMGSAGKLGNHQTDTRRFTIPDSQLSGHFVVQANQNLTRTVDYVLTIGRDHDLTPTVQLPTYDELSRRVKAAWEKRWQNDIIVDGPVQDQQAIHSMLYYLKSAISPQSPMSVSPFGLSNAMYFGHVFWDADMWDFPTYALMEPNQAKAIASYRLNRYRQAQVNSKGKGAKFPWESSVTGKETVPGPSKLELHISGDVAWMLHEAASLGLTSNTEAEDVRKSVSQYFQSVATKDDSSGLLTIPNVMSPDETHTGDNDLYTNLLAQWTHDGNWSGKQIYKLPQDKDSFITYDGDSFRSYKQAAAVLSIYPLQYPPAIRLSHVMVPRFVDKTLKNGPAMSDSVHAAIWARMGERDKAYESWKKSWEPFTQQPLMLFSEKRNKSNTYFVTGAAGSIQSLLFGLIGFRLDSVQEPDAALIQQLQGDMKLSVKANFPKEWKSVKLRNFTVLGKRYNLTATHQASGHDAVVVSQGD